ncbi:hypothetical protein LTR66_017689, partial [Elasticomyces elasticus]
TKDGDDFPPCLERIMAETENPAPTPRSVLTLEEVDAALHQIAANSPFSSLAVKARANGKSTDKIIEPIISRLQSHEAKWFAKMLLKSYSPIEIPEYAVLHSFHFALPKLLQIQKSFEATLQCLTGLELKNVPARVSRDHEMSLMPILSKAIVPQLGTMICRQPFNKSRSIKHCVEMCSPRTMSVERKYDGEYCQIHIDMTKVQNQIQIYSKSGKESTQDRFALHGPIKAGLQLGKDSCKIKKCAILEGELVVWSRNQQKVLPFYHVRKHVLHGGRRIGGEKDSPKKSDEALMIYFYDVLLLDDKILFGESHGRRRANLKKIVTQTPGVAMCVERVMIDFKRSRAPADLRDCFSKAIRRRWEGLVLKGIEDPYFSWSSGQRGIKLKKDYIAGLGDTADLCVVAGHRNPASEVKLGFGQLIFTHFHVAALVNKDEVKRYAGKPVFKIIDSLSIGGLSKDDIFAF